MTYTRLNPAASSMMIVNNFTVDSLSITATNSGKEGSVNIPAVSGYTFMGVVGSECSAWELPITKSVGVLSSMKLYWAVSNPRRVALNFTLGFRLLYVKNSIP